MIGWIHMTLGIMIKRQQGEDAWEKVRLKAGLPVGTDYDEQHYYSDADTVKLFGAAANVVGLPLDSLWEAYGEFLVPWACESGWKFVLVSMAYNLQEFLDSLNALHYFINEISFRAEIRGPSFHCEQLGENALRLHYYSARGGLFPLVRGLLRQAARVLYGVEIRMNVLERTQEKSPGGVTEHVIIAIEAEEKSSHIPIQRKATAPAASLSTPSMPVDLRDLMAIFPYHICFNKTLVIEHVGSHLLRDYELSTMKLVKLTELVKLMQPAEINLTYKHIQTYINSLYVLQLRLKSRRSKGDEKVPNLCLRGQMMPIHDGNSIIFLGSPYVSTIDRIRSHRLFLSDMPLHDATRDLVMLNQLRTCQTQIKKEVESLAIKMRDLSHDMERRQLLNRHFKYRSVPTSVVDSIEYKQNIDAAQIDNCTVLLADLPDILAINTNCNPSEIVSVIDQMLERFDRVVTVYKCTKIPCFLSDYCVVSGLPKPNKDHYQAILNLSMALVFEARKIIVPQLKLPLRLRVSIHSGSLVAGVIMQEKPVYCAMGQTMEIVRAILESGEPNRILVSAETKRYTFAKDGDNFEFEQGGSVDSGRTRTNTHYLTRNTHKTIYEICGSEGDVPPGDGYDELHSPKGNAEWQMAITNAYKKQDVLLAFGSSRSRRALYRLKTVRKKFGGISTASSDSGVSVERDTETSAVCCIT